MSVVSTAIVWDKSSDDAADSIDDDHKNDMPDAPSDPAHDSANENTVLANPYHVALQWIAQQTTFADGDWVKIRVILDASDSAPWKFFNSTDRDANGHTIGYAAVGDANLTNEMCTNQNVHDSAPSGKTPVDGLTVYVRCHPSKTQSVPWNFFLISKAKADANHIVPGGNTPIVIDPKILNSG